MTRHLAVLSHPRDHGGIGREADVVPPTRASPARRPSFMMASTRLLYVPCAQLVGRSSSPSSSRWSSDDDDVRYQRRRCPPPATTMSATRHHAAGSHVGACPWRGALANDRQRPWATRFVLPWPRRMRALNSMPLSEDGQDARTSLLDVAGRMNSPPYFFFMTAWSQIPTCLH